MQLFGKPFKPLLAGTADLMKLTYPVAVSPKIDGIRCLLINGVPVSRSLKPIRNNQIFETLKGIQYFLDGELVAAGGNFQLSTTAVMKADADIPWEYYVFDMIDPKGNPDEPFANRLHRLQEVFEAKQLPVQCKLLPQEFVYERLAVQEIHQKNLALGYEGTIIRSSDGRYKFGRSTTNEGILLKLKDFKDAEARIIGFEELMHNENEATTNALGRTERSSHKENKRASGKLGAFIVQALDDPDVTFKVGTGLTDVMRIDFWNKQDDLMAQVIKYRFFDFGIKTAPRHPVFLGLRHIEDMS